MRHHTPATARIQSRLERSELEHLRELVAAQALLIDELRADLDHVTSVAEMYHDEFHRHPGQKFIDVSGCVYLAGHQ